MRQSAANRFARNNDKTRRSTLLAIAAAGMISVASGWFLASQASVGAGSVGLCFAASRFVESNRNDLIPTGRAKPAPLCSAVASAEQDSGSPSDSASLVDHMLRQGRYAILLRPEIVQNLSGAERCKARLALDAGMAIVPEGEVLVGWAGEEEPCGEAADQPRTAHRPVAVRLERYLLDRYCVTNREFREFVAAGGYEQMSIWEPDIWPGIMDFVDSTGLPGPRLWADGTYPAGEDELPVVGVSWYEAAAYARWVGKRLPTDAEWEKAGSWPMHLSAAGQPQRRFPWGNGLDVRCANLWGSGIGRCVAVDAYEDGASINGIFQLVGNVWEWTSGNFGAWSRPGHDLVLLSPVKSIRGGAFDTYFENQATCQFQSGEDPTSRKHNIGFRCAVSVCDLVSIDDELDTDSQERMTHSRNPEEDVA